jgi:Amidohydrolase family
VTIVVNSSSNLHLRSGIAPVVRMVEAGCRVALGVDGKAFDEDDDALRELRPAHLLHAGSGFAVGVSREKMLQIAFANGRKSVTNLDDGGAVCAGAPADLLLLDWAAIDDDRLRDDIDALDLVLTRATARHIRELIVNGRTVVRDGVVTGATCQAHAQKYWHRCARALGTTQRSRLRCRNSIALFSCISSRIAPAVNCHISPGLSDAISLAGSFQRSRVAVVHHPREAIPLQGNWYGSASDYQAMKVAMKVRAVADRDA